MLSLQRTNLYSPTYLQSMGRQSGTLAGQSQQPQMGGGMPSFGQAKQGLNMYNNYQRLTGGETFDISSLWTSGGTTAGSTAGTAGSGAASGGATAGSSAAGGGGSWLGSAGPWAALAAVVLGNESEGKKGGYRREGSDYWKDLFGGKVIEQDFNKRWSQKLFGSKDKYGFGSDFEAFGELMTLDFSNFFDKAKEGTLGKLLGLD